MNVKVMSQNKNISIRSRSSAKNPERGSQKIEATRWRYSFNLPLSAGTNSVITDKVFDILLQKRYDASPLDYIEGIYSQLNPAAWADMLFHGNEWDIESLSWMEFTTGLLWWTRRQQCLSIVYQIIDRASLIIMRIRLRSLYSVNCQNKNYLYQKLLLQIIMLWEPFQKKDGSVHVITDCSKPDTISINNYNLPFLV